MAEIARDAPGVISPLALITIPRGKLSSLVLAVLALGILAAANRYVFAESNLPFLLVIVACSAIVISSGRIPRAITFPRVAVGFLLLILFAWARQDAPQSFALSAAGPDDARTGFSWVLDLVMYYGLFVTAALAYYKGGRFSSFLWFLCCGYVIAFVVRNSFDIGGLQEGYNLSPGFVLVTLIPFAFLNGRGPGGGHKFPLALTGLCLFWLALIGARTAVGALLLFVVALYAWPLFTSTRTRFHLTFWVVVAGIALLCVFYLKIVVYSGAGLVENSGIGIFRKGLGTRVDIWLQLAYLISQQPWFGYGTDHATRLVSPEPYLAFAFHRSNLSAHSTYFELLYRLGLVGLICYLSVLYGVWTLFWKGRAVWTVRVAGAFLIATLFFSATGEYLVFSELQLRSGFGWIILGLGAGASLLCARKPLFQAG